MARKIKNNKKIKQEDITKNTGKELSSTIARFKKNERKYTFYLVIVFMVTIVVSCYFGLKIDTYKIYDSSVNSSYFSFSSSLVSLNQKHIMDDLEGLKSEYYSLDLSNTTSSTINYVIRLILDEDTVKRCNCADDIVEYDKIRYSLDGETVLSFNNPEMIVETGSIPSKKKEKLSVRFWLDDSVDAEKSHFYGRLVFEDNERERRANLFAMNAIAQEKWFLLQFMLYGDNAEKAAKSFQMPEYLAKQRFIDLKDILYKPRLVTI